MVEVMAIIAILILFLGGYLAYCEDCIRPRDWIITKSDQLRAWMWGIWRAQMEIWLERWAEDQAKRRRDEERRERLRAALRKGGRH